MTDPVKVKEGVGVLVAALVVLAYVGIGFVQVAVFVVFGVEVKLPPDWMAAMLSISSACIGYLIGKPQATQLPTSAVLPPVAAIVPVTANSALPARPVAGNVPQ